MYTHLKGRQYYDDIYDHHTVEWARRDIVYYDNFHDEMKRNLPEGEKLDKPGNAFALNLFYMQVIGNDLLRRYEEREGSITEWMARDRAKDEQITEARLTSEPTCRHCDKQGLRLIDKILIHRGDHYDSNEPEEVLFTLRCPHCEKNTAVWQDGVVWAPKPTHCPKCSAVMTEKTTTTKKATVFTYTCSSCGYTYKDKLDFSKKEEEKPDPDFDKDRAHYCLHDTEFRERLFKMRHDFEEMARLGKEFKEKEDNKHIYDAMKEMKKPKIAELSTILAPVLEKSGYIEFHLDQPEMGTDVYVGFSCLDSTSDRSDYDSRKALKKLVDQVLEDTNWRLMSDGINYRLGYLNGRLRAYEHEEDLKILVAKSKKLLKSKKQNEKLSKNSQQILKDEEERDIIL